VSGAGEGGTPATWSADDWAGERADRWAAVADRVEVQIEPVNDPLFAAAALGAGEVVLDVGCGRGVTTRRAATEVGAGGRVTGLDIADTLLAQARAEASEGAAIEYVAGDAQVHPLPPASFDAVISRFGVMFFDDPTAAFANLFAATRPGGRLAVAVWQGREHSSVMQRPIDVALAAAAEVGVELEPPEPASGPFAFGDPDFVDGLLTAAGWAEVGSTPHLLSMYAGGPGTVEESVETGLTLGPLREAINDVPAEVVDRIRAALVADFTPLHDGVGIPLQGAIAIVTARRPA
jgi:SAM-dependent methyltransferase